MNDRYLVVCNFTEATPTASAATKAYVVHTTGGDPHRVVIRYRSRGGRMIAKWESRTRLDGYRIQTIPPEHPMYAMAREHRD